MIRATRRYLKGPRKNDLFGGDPNTRQLIKKQMLMVDQKPPVETRPGQSGEGKKAAKHRPPPTQGGHDSSSKPEQTPEAPKQK